jgi:hypothetical protein
MASEAAKLGLSIGLKNSMVILPAVKDVIQFAVNEQCQEYHECGVYLDFIATKPVFHIEYLSTALQPFKAKNKRYVSNVAQACASLPAGMTTIIKSLSLDGSVQFCDGSVAYTAVVN